VKLAIELDTNRTELLPRNQQDGGCELAGFDLAEIAIPVNRLAKCREVTDALVQDDPQRISCVVGCGHLSERRKVDIKTTANFVL